MRRARPTRRPTAAALLGAALLAAFPCAPALAQPQNNPVYVDDSLAAGEAVSRAIELSASGNHAEAARVLQSVLDQDGERLLANTADPNLFHTVRDRVHAVLLDRPALLEEYRAVESVEALRLLRESTADADELVERARLLTEPGLDAALRVAQRRIERAQFWSALRVLAQLERHPDLDGQKRERAARLARRAAEYLGADPAAAAIVRSLSTAAANDLEPRPLPPLAESRSPFDPASAIPFDTMLSKPLWSAPIVADREELIAVRDTPPSPSDQPRAAAATLNVIPAVAGDTVFINSGDLIAAFDRYTLAPRWPERRFEPSGLTIRTRSVNRRNLTRGVSADDTSIVAVEGPWLVAVTGAPTGARRLGDPRVHALDTQTGELVWSVDVASLDPALEGASVRGAPVIHAGVVVVAASRQLAQRRLEAVQLVGLDLSTGALLWRTPFASAGSLPYNASTSSADNTVQWRGLALRADELGAIGAVDIASGRPAWIRRSERASLARRESWPYEAHSPVVLGDTLYAVAPDASRILQLDADTGATIAEFETGAIGAPRYLVAADGRLFSVSESAVVALEFGEPPALKGRVIFTAPSPGIRGRVVAAEHSLVIPVRDGVTIARLDQPDAAGRPGVHRIDLDRPGIVLPMHDQLVVVDDVEIHTYLLWETAERQLLHRIENDPADPSPAVVYAELAYRANKPQTLLPAVRLAQRALDRDPAAPASRSSRQRLFASLVEMLKPETPVDAAPLPREVRAGLVDALDALASRPNERASALLLRGEHAQAFLDPARAIAAYQSILDDPALSGAQMRGVGIVRSASDEATRRLRAIVREHGPALYASYDAEADAALARLGAWSEAEAFENLARRYPVAPASVRAWMMAAEAHERAGQPERAALALENGFVVARDALVEDPAVIGELSGRLITLLQRLDRPAAAAQTLARITSEYGDDLALTASGQPLVLASLRESLRSASSEASRRPRIGAIDETATPVPVVGWAIVSPLVQRNTPPARDHIVLASDAEYSLLARTAPSSVENRWSIPRESIDALVRLDDDAAYFTSDTDDGRTILRLDASTGERVWETPPFRSIFGDTAEQRDPRLARAPNQRGPRFLDIPSIGRRQIFEILVVFDERTLTLVERSGRAAAFDTQSGAMLWARDDLPAEVYDIAAEAGVLIVGGSHAARRPGDNAQRTPTVVTLDLRTGRTIHEARPEAGEVRWIRPAGPGRTLVGFDGGVACFDPFRGEQRWFNTSPALRDSVESWAFSDRLIVMDQADRLWQVALDDGAIRTEPLDNASRVSGGRQLRTAEYDGLAVFVSPAGMVAYDASGAIVGKDAALNTDTQIESAFVDGLVLAVEQDETDVRGELSVHKLRLFDAHTGALRSTQRVLLGARPTAVAAIDGFVILTAGQTTIAYPAPPTPGTAAARKP